MQVLTTSVELTTLLDRGESLRVLNLMRRDLIAPYPVKKRGLLSQRPYNGMNRFVRRGSTGQRINARAPLGENQRAAVFSTVGYHLSQAPKNM
jgi:hypothetical protein